MTLQLLEISGEHRYISAHRGFVVIKEGSTELGRVPFDNLLGVIGAGRGITLSQSLLTRLADRGIPYIVCDQSFSPVAIVWSLDGHHLQSRVVRRQIEAKRTLNKRLWQVLIRAKIGFQASVLEAVGQSAQLLPRLQRKVLSGDPDNVEAQAARAYWPMLMGKSFRRSRNGSSPNDLLNYGYTVVRSAVARAACGCGLHPSVSICHKNQFNPMVFIDALLEPFRPFVDIRVRAMANAGQELDAASKQQLASLLHVKCGSTKGVRSLLQLIHGFTRSVSGTYMNGNIELELPRPTRLDWSALATL